MAAPICTTATVREPSRTYTNTALTAIAVMLGVIAVNMSGGDELFSSKVHAQPQTFTAAGTPEDASQGGFVSAAEQRKIMIAELRNMAARLERVESLLSKGVSVKVTDMPPVNIQDRPGADRK